MVYEPHSPIRGSVRARGQLLLIAFSLLQGCAGAAGAGPGAATVSSDTSSFDHLKEQAVEQAARIAELETRLGLIEQEARQWREREPGRVKPVETVRIGAHRREEREEEDRAPHTVIRLHEAEPQQSVNEPLILPSPPEGVATRLGVVALPEARAQQIAVQTDSPQEAYRAALRLLKAGRFQESAQSFSGFLAAFPSDALADDATYWRGESYYAQRRYDVARTDFEQVLERFPASERAADCMLKVGLCHQRLGDPTAAQRFFKKVREQYPSSDAASIASREGAS